MKSRDEALQLVKAAFLQAQRKLGPEATSMTLAVLKNRLLQITDRRFDPLEFGARDMGSFLALLAPDVALTTDGPHPKATLSAASGSECKEAKARRNDPTQPYTPTGSVQAEASLQNSRIREDLWIAILDYSSGRTYGWDEQVGRARACRAEDGLPIMPTLTPVELGEWRRSFVDEHVDTLTGSDLASAQRWQELGLATTYLPSTLQQPWNRELALRVRQRLQAFFSSQRSAPAHSSVEHEPARDSEHAEELLTDALQRARDRGDGFTVGELLAQQVLEGTEDEVEGLMARATCAWAGPRGLSLDPSSLGDLASHFDQFSNGNLAAAFVNVLRRCEGSVEDLSESSRDFAFKLRADIESTFGVEGRSPAEVCRAAMVRLEELLAQGTSGVTRFLRTTPATAKIVSIDLLKLSHRLQPMLVPAERQFLGDLDVLIGPAFRKLCEAYERNEDSEVIRRAPEYLENVKSHRPSGADPRLQSQFWLALVQPVLDHLTTLVEDATSRGEVALAPALSLRNPKTKADLRSSGTAINLSFFLRNQGKGHARDVSLQRSKSGRDSAIALAMTEPVGPFDVPPGGEQLIRLRLELAQPREELHVPVQWVCATTLGKQASFADRLEIAQQVTEPDWDSLLAEPPYTLNPIKRPDRLYGRDLTLNKLLLTAMAGTSTFVWGQKRIGKTSLLQVLATKLAARQDTTCILLRMGELASLHEGQLAHRIAQRLVERSGAIVRVPHETDFGAGISLLVPFAEKLSEEAPTQKFVIIIDEFDDLDPAFYTGERGRQFIKGLRSASEVGLTFFFVGSERMEAIYRRHHADLNKWTNIRLDRIDSRSDCQAMIEQPVIGAIEFDPEAIDFITGYTTGNPFYIHNFCFQLFERCLQEHRTFVDANDTFAIRQQLLKSLGPTNFSHLWDDNPVLEADEKRRQSAENCIALCCISVLGGRYEAFEDLMEVQESLPISPDERATATEMRHARARLLQRGVLENRREGQGELVALQIFREWLGENARSKLLPIWIAYREAQRASQVDSSSKSQPIGVEASEFAFPVAEDELLAVAQRLIYCGKQKDVAEIRSWLRQFDDDSRIEMAFVLLKRIAERGFINEGMRALGLAKIEEMIDAKRVKIGSGAWKMVKGRRDNLAIGYVDSDHKSGASTAREAMKMLRPGKCTPATELETWMSAHIDGDALVAIVDDFAGTGETLVKGLRKFQAKVREEVWQRYIHEKRIAVFVMYAFPDALEALRTQLGGVDAFAATVLGDELRACDEAAQLFDSDADRTFAREVLQQIGRELTPSAPLGHGDMGALVVFHNASPNNTLPIFWSNGTVGERPWRPLFPRA